MTLPVQAYLHPAVKILKAHPCGLLAVEKPAGVLSHPNGPQSEAKALVKGPYSLDAEYYDLGGGAKVHVLHRLDGPTSGVILLGLNEELAKAVKALFRERRIVKRYHCLVKGKPPAYPKVWLDKLQRKEGPSFIRMQSGMGSEAKTEWTLVHQGKELSTLSLAPLSGLSHQLRVQCSLRHSPIVGDQTYGDFKFNRKMAPLLATKNLCLHASSIAFELEYQGKRIAFEAHSPLPVYFELAKQYRL